LLEGTNKAHPAYGMGRKPTDQFALEINPTTVELVESCDQVKKSCLSASIGTNQACYASITEFKSDIVYSSQSTKAFCYILDP
jgi:hypothetical protein